MLSPQPQLFLLGPDSIIIYNTAYGRLLYDHHPLYLGRPMEMNEALISNAHAINRIVDRATTRAKPANENDVIFFFKHGDRLQETFLSATMVKLPGSLQGYHATTYDTTAAAVKTRRKKSLKAIMDACALASGMTSFWEAMLQGISTGDGDISLPCSIAQISAESTQLKQIVSVMSSMTRILHCTAKSALKSLLGFSRSISYRMIHTLVA
ncbi:unnamed protein product [Aureobasidium pullulans]|nr:unnamed protein product [Aureobasidium pullulans]